MSSSRPRDHHDDDDDDLDLQNCQESAMTDSKLTSLVFFFKNPTRSRSNSAIAQCKEGARKLVLLF